MTNCGTRGNHIVDYHDAALDWSTDGNTTFAVILGFFSVKCVWNIALVTQVERACGDRCERYTFIGWPEQEVESMMLSSRWQGCLMIRLVAIVTVTFATPALAQRDSGIMIVRVADPDGAPLPGGMVVSRGPVGTQTQYTGIDGSARFPGLYPGDGYVATFTLDGFSTVIREDVVIGAGRTTAFDVTMELASVQETVTVTGETPVVDVIR